MGRGDADADEGGVAVDRGRSVPRRLRRDAGRCTAHLLTCPIGTGSWLLSFTNGNGTSGDTATSGSDDASIAAMDGSLSNWQLTNWRCLPTGIGLGAAWAGLVPGFRSEHCRNRDPLRLLDRCFGDATSSPDSGSW